MDFDSIGYPLMFCPIQDALECRQNKSATVSDRSQHDEPKHFCLAQVFAPEPQARPFLSHGKPKRFVA